MIVRPKTRIHNLAIKTIEQIKKEYDSRLFKSSRMEAINSLIESLNNDQTDEEIIWLFEAALEAEKNKTTLADQDKSIFINKVENFLEKVELILEITVLKSNNLKLIDANSRLVIEKEFFVSTQYYNECKSPLYLLLKEPALLKNILFFIDIDYSILHDHKQDLFDKHYKDIGKLCLTSKFFNSVMSEDNFKQKLEIKEKKDIHTYYTSGSMQVFFRTRTDRVITIRANPNDSIEHCKKAYEYFEGVPPEQNRFIFAGRQLEDGKTLEDYNIQKQSTIHSVLRLSGD